MSMRDGLSPLRRAGAIGESQRDAGGSGAAGLVAHAADVGRDGRRAGEACGEPGAVERPERLRDAGELGDTGGTRLQVRQRAELPGAGRQIEGRAVEQPDSSPGPTNGFWRDAEWIWCRDEKWRAVEPTPERMAPGLAAHLGSVRVGGASFFHPLQTGSKASIMRLKAYGDCINAEVAKEFIRAYMSL